MINEHIYSTKDKRQAQAIANLLNQRFDATMEVYAAPPVRKHNFVVNTFEYSTGSAYDIYWTSTLSALDYSATQFPNMRGFFQGYATAIADGMSEEGKD